MLKGIKARAERAAALGRAAGQPGVDRISTRRCQVAAEMVAVESGHMTPSSSVASPPLPNANA